MQKFLDRHQAGEFLAAQVAELHLNHSDLIALALPRGGVPVAYEIAKTLSIPLDVFIVRKLGVPEQPELAMGAIAADDIVVFNNAIIQELNISKTEINQVITQEQQELTRRERMYRGDSPFPSLTDKILILVDDGIATGATMKVAIKALKMKKPKKIILAVPVIALSIYEEMRSLVDEVICSFEPTHLDAVGSWYENFTQTTDEEVFELLAQASQSLSKNKS